MVDNKLKSRDQVVNSAITPIAVNVASGSEVHAAEQNQQQREISNGRKSVAENKQKCNRKPVVAEKSDNKAVVADKKLQRNQKIIKTEAIGNRKIVEKSLSEEKQNRISKTSRKQRKYTAKKKVGNLRWKRRTRQNWL